MFLSVTRLFLALTLYVIGAFVLGLALVPAALLCRLAWLQTAGLIDWQRIIWVCVATGAGYFLFGFSLISLTVILRVLLRLDLKEGEYPIASLGMLKWYLSNALQFLVWTTFGNFLLLTPFASLFFRLMGARVGLNVQINSGSCADLSLLDIGDDAVIGGHATVIAHSFEQRGLILKRVKIGRGAIIGLNAIVMPGTEVGDQAVVVPGAFVPKETKIEPKEIYIGRR
jgi:hypothetical protein